jgi:hypothetical protein
VLQHALHALSGVSHFCQWSGVCGGRTLLASVAQRGGLFILFFWIREINIPSESALNHSNLLFTEAAQQAAKEDDADHARMKAQQRDILKNLLQKEKELAIKASPWASLKTALTHAMAAELHHAGVGVLSAN